MATAKDPVCGMDVYFCSPGCKDQFDRHPDRYIGRKVEQQRKSV